jgi:hypothetical protein
MAFLLLSAGHETTLHWIALNVLTPLDHPQEPAELTIVLSSRYSGCSLSVKVGYRPSPFSERAWSQA